MTQTDVETNKYKRGKKGLSEPSNISDSKDTQHKDGAHGLTTHNQLTVEEEFKDSSHTLTT